MEWILSVTIAAASFVGAQEERARREIKGTLVAIEPETGEITLSVGGDEPRFEKFIVPREVKPVIDGKPRSLADFAGRIMVFVRLAEDGRSVTGLIGEAPRLSGVLRSVDADKGTVTIAVRGEEDRTLTVAKDAAILMGGRPVTTAELRGGMRAALRLTLDGRSADVIRVGGDAPEGARRDGAPKLSGGLTFQKMDADGDGAVSKAEFEAAFAALDKDGDGRVSAEETRGRGDGDREGGRRPEGKPEGGDREGEKKPEREK